MICFRGDVHEALTGVTLAIIEQHLLDSFRLLIRNAFSPWSLYHYLLRTHFRWWNVWADLDQSPWTDFSRAELYARQARNLHRGYCPLSRTGLDKWINSFHSDAGEIPTMLKVQMRIIQQQLPALAQCGGSISHDYSAFTQHAASKAWYDSEDEDEDFFRSELFHHMCSARSIR